MKLENGKISQSHVPENPFSGKSNRTGSILMKNSVGLMRWKSLGLSSWARASSLSLTTFNSSRCTRLKNSAELFAKLNEGSAQVWGLISFKRKVNRFCQILPSRFWKLELGLGSNIFDSFHLYHIGLGARMDEKPFAIKLEQLSVRIKIFAIVSLSQSWLKINSLKYKALGAYTIKLRDP